MAGKTVTLTRNTRIKNKLRKAGDKVQVDAELLAELEAAGAIKVAAAEDGEKDSKKTK